MSSKSSSKRGRPKNPDSGNKLVLRVDLEAELQSDFMKIKRDQGLTNNTEVLRFCIREMASEKIFKIPLGMYHLVEELVDDKRIQDKFFTTSVSEFLTRALQQFIRQVNPDRSNLHDWDYRSTLNTTERDIANKLIDLQTQNPTWGVTIEELIESLSGNYSESDIKNAIRSFKEKKLVKEMEYNNKIFHYAVDRNFLTDQPVDF